ncbi:MAG: hypothetical protein Kow00108_24920 [Calditrichia bacterium]
MESIQELMQKAHTLFLEEKYPEAEEIYKDLLYERMIDGNDRVLVEIEFSWLLYRSKRYDEALAILKRLSDVPELTKRQQFDIHRLTGFCYVVHGDNVSALHHLQQAVQIEIEEFEKRFIYYELGRLYFLQGDYPAALQELSIAHDYFTDDDEYFYAIKYYLGFIHLFQDNLEDAFAEFSFIIENSAFDDKVVGGMYGIAQVFMKQGEYERVIQSCKDILSLDPDFSDRETLAYMMVRSYYELQDWNSFSLFYRQLKSQYPEGMYKEIYRLFDKKMSELGNSVN